MKILVIPDSHLKIEVIENGLELADKLRADKVVLLGDYFDDWEAIDRDYYDMVSYLKHLLRRDPRVVALMGNHELSYMGYPCAGFKPQMRDYLYENLFPDHRFYIAAAFDSVLYSHAGVCSSWLQANKIITANDLRYKLSKRAGAEFLEVALGNVTRLDYYAQAGKMRGGSGCPSPLWADARELVADPAPNIKQVVGHTPVPEIQCVGKCWFTDVYSNYNTSDEYLFVVNGNPEVVHYGDLMYEK